MRLEDILVEVRDKSLARKGAVLADDLDIEVYPLHNGVGAWNLTLPTSHPLCKELRTPGSGIIVTGPNDVILSGPTNQPEFSATTDDSAGTVTFNGVGDSTILAEMLAWPQPANGDVQTQNVATDDRTGPAESLMHAYVKANVGPDAPANRRNVHLTMGTDGGRGAITTKSAQFDVLGSLLTDLAGPSRLGFRVVQRDKALVFETYRVEDMSKTIRLTLDNGDLSSQKVTTAAPTTTRAIVGGAGEDVWRTFQEVSSADSLVAEGDWGRRMETFVDERTNVDPDILTQAGMEVLTDEGNTAIGIEAVPAEDSARSFGADWNLGDMVGVEIDGNEVALVVGGAAIKANEDGFKFGIVFGDSGAITDRSTRSLSGVEARVSALERTTGINFGQNRGSFAGLSTDATGLLVVPHGLTAAPVEAYGQGWGTLGLQCAVHAVDATNITFKFRTAAGAALTAATAVFGSWRAYL